MDFKVERYIIIQNFITGFKKTMNKKRRASLQDVANQVGVTKMTISRFLKDPNLVSEITREKISTVIDTLGYVPNRAPEMLLNAKSYTIGVLIPSLTNLVFSEVLRGIESVTTPLGYQTMLGHYGYHADKEEQLITSLLSYNIDGLLLSESNHTPKTKNIIEQSGIPVIEMMDIDSHTNIQSVGFNNVAAAYAMTTAMIERGHRNIVYFAARMDLRTQLKMQGYQNAMNAHRLTPRTIETKAASSFSLGATLLNQTLESYPETDGIFCTNDDLAIGVVFECHRQKIRIPEQLAVAGFHGHDVGQAMYPKLATIITPRKRIGQVAAEVLIAHLTGASTNSLIHEAVIDLGFEVSLGESI